MPGVAQELVGSSIGPYDVLGVIGEGGMGVVYKGVHRALDQLVAIKALSAGLSVNSEMRERFLQEARIQAKLTHPNIVNLLNFIEEAGSFYLVMEFIEGETLEALIRRVGLVPPERAVAISLQVLDALTFAHEKGIIHRDVKPSNIMITSSGVAKITDFGIAKIMGAKRQTATGVRPGTLWYMSPEQVKGGNLDARSDIYSFGITLYQMVTGKVPFDADSEYGIMRAHVELQPPPPREVYPYISDHLEKTILRCLAKDPADRFQTSGGLAETLRGQEVRSLVAERGQAEFPSQGISFISKILQYRKQVGWGVGLLAALFLVSWTFEIMFMAEPQKTSRPSSTQPPPLGPPVRMGVEKPSSIDSPPETSLENREGEGSGGKPLPPVSKPPPVAKKDPPRPNNGRIRDHIRTAWVYMERGQYPEAVSELEKAKSLDPENKEVLANLERARKAWKAEQGLQLNR